jgi:CRISPR-associated endoribonuclease Cas6
MNGMPDLYALVLRLRPEQGGPLPAASGHQAQALFLELVRQVDPDLSNALHADAPSKPFSVAVLPGGRMPRDEATLELRVAFTRAELFPPVTRTLLQQTARPALRLGTVPMVLTDVLGMPGSHPWAGFSSFAALWEQIRPAPMVTLEFATPTAFGQGTRPDGRPRLGLLPTPEAVFGSLARRWNELAPPGLHIDEPILQAAIGETLVSRYTLRSTQISLGKGPQKGFIGICSYELPTDPEAARVLVLLAEAGFYLGVGMKTARGMGLCRRIDGHPPGRAHERAASQEAV